MTTGGPYPQIVRTAAVLARAIDLLGQAKEAATGALVAVTGELERLDRGERGKETGDDG